MLRSHQFRVWVRITQYLRRMQKDIYGINMYNLGYSAKELLGYSTVEASGQLKKNLVKRKVQAEVGDIVARPNRNSQRGLKSAPELGVPF